MSVFDRMMQDGDEYYMRITTDLVSRNKGAAAGRGLTAAEAEQKKRFRTEIENQSLKKENEQLKNQNKDLKNENVELEKQKDQLQKLAVNIAIDRSAIYNTINYLAAKWGKKIDEKEKQEIDRAIDQKYEELKNNEDFVERKTKEISHKFPKTKK